ncbi:hypothetical protein BASA50_005141 [Batrachochytrium salamandrivorans]|uniref:Ubiquitin-like domain-containing protein n=1 Tax=Batrachochytrium salamandrivorans TaxID=1357716 RepID=A0ABQ8FGS3_9FUNG|nr:hypothetical protein BASA60_006042 [Batrachochytrium salamandrivorans]KAH6578098.1 hypothetical protein BASA62_000452 [Batrachochytrium salamandrivorans]KAH6581480.1 hypothetical protein BASA61_009061 [Batrachochytrium salamandrivorans]KAH6596435.1 hypothetical protein BASA50_005141 [Batrachochytrium salamandrivorans]KAH9265395.1 hypothetical protein BASA84_001668 [Batrachochytrium salamandrivorans]
MLLLVKRHKTTFMVEAFPADTVMKLKARLLLLLGKEREAMQLRLLYRPLKQTGYTPLEDAAVLEQVGVVDQDTLYLVYCSNEGPDGKWEAVDVPPYDSLHDEIDTSNANAASTNKGKTAAPPTST